MEVHENMYGIRGGLIYISVACLFSPKRGVFVILYNSCYLNNTNIA